MKNFLNDHFRFRNERTATPPSTPNHSRYLRSQTHHPENNHHGHQRSVQPTFTNLQATLRLRDDQLRKEQRRYNKLDTAYDRMQIDNTRLKDEFAKAEKNHEDVEARYNHVVDTCISPYAANRKILFNAHQNESLVEVLRPLAKDAMQARALRNQLKASQDAVQPLQNGLEASQNEIQNLRLQVNTLQTELLARVEKVDVFSDEQLALEFRNLVASIKTLSRTVRCSRDLCMTDHLSCAVMLENVSQHHWQERGREKYLIEAWVWSILIYAIFDSPFLIFGGQYKCITDYWIKMFGSDHLHNWPSPTTVCENWRYTTMKHLSEVVTDETANAIGLADPEPNVYTTITSVLGAYLESKSSGSCNSQIGAIADRACALALQMGRQRSRLQITYPAPGARFVEQEMSSLPDLDGDDIADGVVAFIVNPGLTKWGDASGKNLDQRYDIVPSLVQLEAHPAVIKVETYADVVKVEAKSE